MTKGDISTPPALDNQNSLVVFDECRYELGQDSLCATGQHFYQSDIAFEVPYRDIERVHTTNHAHEVGILGR